MIFEIVKSIMLFGDWYFWVFVGNCVFVFKGVFWIGEVVRFDCLFVEFGL